jgi:hypothetical protein
VDSAGLNGRCGLLRKPFSLAALRDQVGTMLAGRDAPRRPGS